MKKLRYVVPLGGNYPSELEEYDDGQPEPEGASPQLSLLPDEGGVSTEDIDGEDPGVDGEDSGEAEDGEAAESDEDVGEE